MISRDPSFRDMLHLVRGDTIQFTDESSYKYFQYPKKDIVILVTPHDLAAYSLSDMYLEPYAQYCLGCLPEHIAAFDGLSGRDVINMWLKSDDKVILINKEDFKTTGKVKLSNQAFKDKLDTIGG